MKLKKILALLLCMTMIAAILTGCTQKTKSPFVSDAPAVSPSPSDAPGASPSAPTLNFATAYASLDPKTVMLTINENAVTWDELFYFIYYNIYQLQSQGDPISDWSAVVTDEDTYKDYILDAATSLALQYAALNYGAGQLNVTLTEEDNAAIKSDWDAQVTAAGSEEAFIAQLEAQYCTKELFTKLSGLRYLAQGCFASLYGKDGSKLSDQDVADSTAEDGYLMAKHILFSTEVTDETGATTPLPDDQKAAVKAKAEKVLSQLKNYKGDDFDAYFDELMNANSEDKGGLASFPDGYLFQSGNMVSAFESATKALEIGQLDPELVESEFGYHIIYRLPINYDTAPIASANSGSDSLRLITAQNMFNAIADTWMNSLNVVYSEQYKALDFNKIFAAG